MALPSTPSFLTSLFHSLSTIQPSSPALNPYSNPTPSPPPPNNPLLNTPPNLKPLLLTLHVLFPNELLPALDLLDRRLVTRLHVTPPPAVPASAAAEQQAPAATSTEQEDSTQSATTGDAATTLLAGTKGAAAVYFVRSASGATKSRSRVDTADETGNYRDIAAPGLESGGRIYEVRLRAWNCTCPAFTFAVFARMGGVWEGNVEDGQGQGMEMEGVHVEGGLTTEEDIAEGSPGWLQFGGMRRGAKNQEAPVCKHLLAALLVDATPLFKELAEEKVVSMEEAAGWIAGWGDS